MMSGLLSVFGLVSARRHAAVVAQLKKAEATAASWKVKTSEAHAAQKQAKIALDKAHAAAHAEAHAAKSQAKAVLDKTHADAHAAQKTVKAALEEARREASRQAEHVEKIKGELERRAQQAKGRVVDAETLQTRLGDAGRELTIAREHLMAVEVKLDILEGAANVLDSRVRSVLTCRTAADRAGAVPLVSG